MTDAELAELLRLVLARPDDHAALGVYADALTGLGDPRGELIVVQLARLTTDSAELVQRERELVTQLSAELGGRLGQGVAFAWALGFVDAIDLEPSQDHRRLADIFHELAVVPAARRLRRIVIRSIAPGWGTFAPSISALGRMASKALRELVITHQPRPGSVGESVYLDLGDLGALGRALPRLEVLEISGSGFNIASFEASSLRRLVIGRASGYELIPLASTRMARLEELVLECNVITYLERVLENPTASRLRRLGLHIQDRDGMRQLALAVPRSRLARPVRVLSLRGRALDRECVDSLLASASWLRGLERLEVEVAGAERQRLAEALGGVLVVC